MIDKGFFIVASGMLANSLQVAIPETERETEVETETKKRQNTQRGTRFPEDSLMPESWAMFCAKERPDLNIMQTWEQFRDYWIAQPGQKGVKLNWDATWRNWVRNQKKTQQAMSKSAQTNQTVMSGLTRGLIGGGNVKLLGS